MAKKRGRPKGSKNKFKDDFVIPSNADIWYEVWFKQTMYGYTRKQFLPELVTALFMADGDIEKVKTSNKAKWIDELREEKPTALRGKKLYITRSL